MTLKEIASEMTKVRNLSTIIEKKKEEFEKEFVKKNTNWRESGWTVPFVDSRADKLESFLEKAIRESVEEALLEVRPKFNYEYDGRSCFFEADFDSRVKEFMK